MNSPSVIGQGGWQQFTHLFYGGNGIIYAATPHGASFSSTATTPKTVRETSIHRQ